ncbi:Multidrug resistance-associated protein 5 [Mactra antiquata]
MDSDHRKLLDVSHDNQNVTMTSNEDNKNESKNDKDDVSDKTDENLETDKNLENVKKSEEDLRDDLHGDKEVNEKTIMLANDSSTSSDSDSNISEAEVDDDDQVDTIDDRVEDMTKSLLALDGGEMSPDKHVTHKKKFGRYRHALKGVIPVRFDKIPSTEFPSSKAGCLSLTTFSWQTSMMWNIYKKGIDTIANLKICDTEKCESNADRLGRIWEEEVKKYGPKKASFARAMYTFVKTRLFYTLLLLILTIICQFLGPAFVLHSLLSYLNSGDVNIGIGVALVLALTCTELGRSLFFALSWYINYTTGVRVRTATQGLLYRKILKLRGLEDKTVGELVNLLNNDGQRIFESAAIGPLMFPGPVALLLGTIYLLHLIGPWALVTMGTFLAFYPFMFLISKLTNYYRRKCISVTDKRVRMMNELLSCIKLIKMYAWEKSFSKAIGLIRTQERGILEKGAYVQSISSATAPLVPVIASVVTFVAYIKSGNELTPVIAFTVIAVLNSMRFSLGVLPFAVKAMADAYVSFKRYKSILLMPEMEPHPWLVFNDRYALVMNKCTFRWEKESSNKEDKKSKKVKVKGNKDSQGKTEELQVLKSGIEQTNGDISYIDVPTLQSITLMAEKGKLIGICGSVGSGKSSLLSAVLGRMIHTSGKIAVQGSLAYVTQQAWIMNVSVRENILFGEPFDPVRYRSVVEACALAEDFLDFVDGDQTEIGERGINLSGGQKQRISLARAVYSNKDIYLLDDPLSAVDIHVGRHIFSECIMKELGGKTVLFVTHQLQYLSKCDNVIFIRDGTITDTGTHTQLMSADTEYANLIKMFYTKEKEKEGSHESFSGERPKSLHKQFSIDHPGMRQRTLSSGSKGSHDGVPGSPSTPSPKSRRNLIHQMSVISRGMSVEEESKPQTGGKLIVAEEKKDGKVGWQTYSSYMKAAGGYILSIFVILVFAVAIATQSFSSWWLSYWLNQGGGNTTEIVGNNTNITVTSTNISDNPNINFYMMVYVTSLGAMIVLTLFRAFIFMKVTLKASSHMHNDIFKKMLSSPMKFFDTTPVGRIINRFSSDLDEIDTRLPATSEMFLQNICMILFALAIISYVSPYFLIALIPLIICFIVLNIIFSTGVRELMRMNQITKSPVISHVTATVQGISTVYAYNKTDQFLDKFNKLMDRNTAYFYLFYCSNRWLAFRLDIMSTCVVGITGLCIVVTYNSLTPALAGLALSFAIQMTGLFQFTIRQAIETESKFIAVQRLQHYSQDVESEAPAVIKDKRPQADWPKPGEIKFVKYKMRYRDNLPLALKGVGFTIKAKEKIGIVGRSGSGKSSLGVALFRLVEPASGTIMIDDIDITQIGLEDLRSRLAIIPQDPVLFVGTVRYNLDPFSKHNDDELWQALGKCHVKDAISSLEKKLDHQVVENGENFSVGERQLLCMARALLRNSKILMLDEATAAIDTETDALVQQTIKEAFSECTMLIIAHRLNTVLGCDRILVMEDGKVVEYGRPKDLMASNVSKFKTMLEATEKQHETVDLG